MMKRIEWLDGLKGFGIILVMMSHTIHFVFLYVLYSGFIPLFFIASAFTFKYNGCKIKRLLIPYFFYGILFLSMGFIIGLHINLDNIYGVLYARCYIFKDLSGSRMLPSVISPLWFLPAMFSTVLFLHLRKKLMLKFNAMGGEFACCFNNNSVMFLSNNDALVYRYIYNTRIYLADSNKI